MIEISIKKQRIIIIFLLAVFFLLNLALYAEIATLTEDGAWCWFADPRGFYHQGIQERTYLGWITRSGDVQAAQYDHRSGQLDTVTVRTAFQVDDHGNPSLLLRPDGHVMIFYCRHTSDRNMYYRVSSNPEDITSWGAERTVTNITSGNVTYPSVFFLPAENNRLFLFYRGIDWQPTMQTSSDAGETWGQPQKIIQIGERPYTKYESDSNGRIHIAFTDGHPRNEPSNGIYHIYYENGAFYRSDGSYIKAAGSSAVTAAEATRVYDASQGRGWIWDIALDGSGNPVLVYAAMPQENNHNYRYARWNGSNWQDYSITAAGGWFPETPAGSSEPEPHYSGGIILDHDNPSVVYLSREISGVFEIEKWTTFNGGGNWSSRAVTSNSSLLNVRPFVPRNHKPGEFDVVWMQGHYEYYTNYGTALRYVTKNPPPGQAPATRFDFGTPTSPVAAGFTRGTDLTLYIQDGYYGWLDTQGNTARDRAIGNDLERDLVFNSTSRTFRVILPKGEYEVQALLGDGNYPHDNISLQAGGTEVATGISMAAGQWQTVNFSLNVTAGIVDLVITDNGGDNSHWVINSLEFTALSPVVPGDVNGDGEVTIVDALQTAQHYVDITVPGFNARAADVNGDGQITIVDALMIAQYYVGLLDDFPVSTGTCPAAGGITYYLGTAGSPTAEQQEAYNLIREAMDTAVKYYNCYTNIVKQLYISYVPSVPTADGNINGSIRFGSRASINHITALHEISHTVGIGTASNWSSLVSGGIFTGKHATAQLRAISGDPQDQLHADSNHFWPHGLNYPSEVSGTQDLVNHCLMVTAIRQDLGL